MPPGERLVFGFMTGTSIDALDGAAVAISGRGLEVQARVEACVTLPLGPVAGPLRALASGEALPARAIARAALDAANLHVEAVQELKERAGAPDLVALHGQTVFHAPPASWQLVNPWPVAREAGCPVVHDLRGADLAAGGQGAPITPIADWVLFRFRGQGDGPARDGGPGGAPDGARAIINLGGFCNVTLLPAAREGESAEGSLAQVRGMDVCACNQVLDAVARRALGASFDEGGARAARGRVHEEAAEALRDALRAQSRSRRSLGTGDEAALWTETWAARLAPDDLAATAASAVGGVIGESVREAGAPICAGGGTMNAVLMRAVERGCGRRVERTDALGVPASHREAACMAVLGALCEDGVAITLPGVTGVSAPAPIAGCWASPSRDIHVALRSAGAGAFTPTLPERAHADDSSPPSRELPVAPSPPPPDRARIHTELRNPRTMRLDRVSILDCIRMLNAEDAMVPVAVAEAAPQIARFVEAAARCLEGDGRLIYVGAGTSGRLGVLDASECPPTFRTPPEKIIGVIAGGDAALRVSSEGKEDDPAGAHAALVSLAVDQRDALLGIAAGSTTPYVLGALENARSRGALTGLLVCSPIEQPPFVDHLIFINTGPEPLTGSTRMKAGTATKLVLNTISTTLMVRMGKVYENLMVDLRATNDKLRDRAARIVSELTGATREDAFGLLDRAGGAVKTAVVMARAGLTREDAERRLAAAGGALRAALELGGQA